MATLTACLSCDETLEEITARGYTFRHYGGPGTECEPYVLCTYCDGEAQEMTAEYLAAVKQEREDTLARLAAEAGRARDPGKCRRCEKTVAYRYPVLTVGGTVYVCWECAAHDRAIMRLA